MTTLASNPRPQASPADIAPFALVGPADRDRLAGLVVDACPLTPDQAAVAAGAPAVVRARRVAGFSAEHLREAVDALVRTHEVLRTSVDREGAEPLCLVHAESAVPVNVVDVVDVDLVGLVTAERAAVHEGATLRVAAVPAPEGGATLLVSLHPVLAAAVDPEAVLDGLRDAARHAPAVRHAPRVAAERAGLLDRAGRAHWRAVTDGFAPFTLPTPWTREAGPGAVEVPVADLAPGLAVLGPLPEVLLAAHLKVLTTLTNEPSMRSDVVLPRPEAWSAFEPLSRTGVVPRTEASSASEPASRGDVVVPRPEALSVPGGPLPFAVTAPATTWRDLVAAVRETAREAARHRPAHRRPAVAAGELRRHALFETRGGLPVVPEEDRGYGVHVIATAEALLVRTVLRPGSAATLGPTYRSVLEAMAADPDGDARGTHLPPAERDEVLSTWGAGPRAALDDTTAAALIETRARVTPEAVAVRVGTVELTFRALDERATRIARHLASLGFGQPDTVVGVCLRRTPDLLPALLGTWKAGAGYLALDPDLPVERVRHMLESTGCRVVLSDTAQREFLGGTGFAGRAVWLDEQRDAIDAHPTTRLPTGPRPEHLAYVIYTSGSTGTPKGVMVEHRGLLNYLSWTVDAYAAHGSGGSAVFSSTSFDLGIPNLFTPLLTGQPVHLLPEPLAPADLGRHLVEGGPYSFVKMTPGHLDLLCHQLDTRQAHALAGVVVAAGDAFPATLADRWIRLAGPGGTKVATEYGPTEITIGNSGQPVTGPPATELVPLGPPIPNTTMYVLDAHLEPVAVGVPGEIHIGGVGVARGYLGRPGLTAERFRPDPHGRPGDRLYRTGDLAQWLPDGSLNFLGRADDQVKIRGYRVELGEVQAAVTRHPQVRDAVVVARESTPGVKVLACYVVAARGARPDPAALRARLAAELPDYMVPATVTVIDRIPLTANGKVDHRALPAP
ncbi:amino acid adenylation domain-containing protein [Actinosynnema sp. NPDC059335]|uniref:non-ribosomal peptide synthetase family protein n=1 Tax=Actinosynnema sp. NPDC059335 TaxID=3346804 RepID=UPI00366A74B9